MSAAVETNGRVAAFASREVPAWHLLGTVFDKDDTVTTDGMLDLSHLKGWDIRKVPVSIPGVDADRHVTEFHGIVRTNPFDGLNDALAVVGGRYEVFQNEETMTFAQDVIGSLGQWETMGSLNGGRKVFGSLIVPNPVILDPEGRADVVNDYLLAVSSHDGSKALQILNTPVRVVCQNTLNMALSGAKVSYTIRHTQSINGKVQAAREASGRNQAYMDTFSKEMGELIQREIDGAKFDEIVAAVYPAPDKDASKAAVTRYGNRVDLLQNIYAGAADGPNTMVNITGTAYGALNAMTEALDWYRKPRKGSSEATLAAASGLDPATNAEKNRILSAVKELTA